MSPQPSVNSPARRRVGWAFAIIVLLGLGSAGAWLAAGGWGDRAQKSAPPERSSASGALPLDDVCLVAPPSAYDPASGLPVTAARAIPADARCPVCGMYPARSPEWAAQVIFSQGDAHFFDSPLSLFLYLQNVGRYSAGRTDSDITNIYVSNSRASFDGRAETDGDRWIDARSAFYVHGSNAAGPMRAGNLPAFATQEAAQTFAQQRGGQVLSFVDVDAAVLASLTGKGGHRHQAGVNKPPR